MVAARTACRSVSIRHPAPGTGCWRASSFVKSHLRQGVFGGEQGLLGLQHGDQVHGAGTQLGFRHVEGLLRILYRQDLEPLLPRELRQRDQRLLDIGEGRQYRLAIGLQVLCSCTPLACFNWLSSRKPSKSWLGQPRGQGIEPGARAEQRRASAALCTPVGGGQLYLRKALRRGPPRSPVGGGEPGLRPAGYPAVGRAVPEGRLPAPPAAPRSARSRRPWILKFAGARPTSTARAAIFCLDRDSSQRRDRGALGSPPAPPAATGRAVRRFRR